jgi:hypothetical protein
LGVYDPPERSHDPSQTANLVFENSWPRIHKQKFTHMIQPGLTKHSGNYVENMKAHQYIQEKWD